MSGMTECPHKRINTSPSSITWNNWNILLRCCHLCYWSPKRKCLPNVNPRHKMAAIQCNSVAWKTRAPIQAYRNCPAHFKWPQAFLQHSARQFFLPVDFKSKRGFGSGNLHCSLGLTRNWAVQGFQAGSFTKFTASIGKTLMCVDTYSCHCERLLSPWPRHSPKKGFTPGHKQLRCKTGSSKHSSTTTTTNTATSTPPPSVAW